MASILVHYCHARHNYQSWPDNPPFRLPVSCFKTAPDCYNTTKAPWRIPLNSNTARHPTHSLQGIDKLTGISPFWLRFVFAHIIQLVDYHSYLFFKRVRKIKKSLIFKLTCQYHLLINPADRGFLALTMAAGSIQAKVWPGTESNCRHRDFQSPALPTELPGQINAGATGEVALEKGRY